MRRGQQAETLLLITAVAAMAILFVWFVTQPAAQDQPQARASPSPLPNASAAASPSPPPLAAQQEISTKDGTVQASHSSSYSDGVVRDEYTVSNLGDEPVDVGISSAVSPALAESPSQVSFAENNTANSTMVSTQPPTVYSEAALQPRSNATRRTTVRNASTTPAEAGRGVAHVVTAPLSDEEKAQVAPVVQQMASANVSLGSQAADVVEKILNDDSKPFEDRVQKAREYLSDVEEAFRNGRPLPAFDLLARLQDSVSVTVSDSFPYASADVQLLPVVFGQPLVRLEGFGSSASVEEETTWNTRFARLSFDFSNELQDGRLPF
ncbi:MAG: hypothetical protein AB1626_01245, partial [Candidatus Micrarchaeota archaeon]